MNRRSFLASMFAACTAPAIVRAESLMRVVPTATFGYGLPPVGVFVRACGVTPWETWSVVGMYLDKPEPIGYATDWRCDIQIASELCIRSYNVTSVGFLANTLGGLLVADPKAIRSWELVSPDTSSNFSIRRA